MNKRNATPAPLDAASRPDAGQPGNSVLFAESSLLRHQIDILTQTLNLLGKAVIVAAGTGKIVFVSTTAAELLDRGDGLYLENDMLHAHDASAEQALAALITQLQFAGADAAPDKGELDIPRTGGAAPYHLLLLRLENSRHNSDAAALTMLIRDVEFHDEQWLQRLRNHYVLTRREGDIVLALTQGTNLKLLADQLGISENTLRQHIKHIFAKMGVHRQYEMISAALKLRRLR